MVTILNLILDWWFPRILLLSMVISAGPIACSHTKIIDGDDYTVSVQGGVYADDHRMEMAAEQYCGTDVTLLKKKVNRIRIYRCSGNDQ